MNMNKEFQGDELLNPEFEQVIHDFCKITSRKFNIFEISHILETMRMSKIIDYVTRSPDATAVSCLKNLVDSNPNLPQSFVGKLLAVVKTEVNITPNTMYANQSFVTRVVTRSVEPPTVVTNFTVASMKQQLRRDVENQSAYSVAWQNVVPNEIKLQLNQRVFSMLINSMSDLCKSIVEGNRAQGRHVDSFIKSQIKY